MPVMDGIEATRGVVLSAPGANVVIVTGSRDERDEARAREAGAAAYVPKEASVEDLRDIVCEVGTTRVVSLADARRQLRRSA
jgi:DNA-binding NarL/FixJ family response regulator